MILFLVCNTHEIYHVFAKKSELGLYRIRTFQLMHGGFPPQSLWITFDLQPFPE